MSNTAAHLPALAATLRAGTLSPAEIETLAGCYSDELADLETQFELGNIDQIELAAGERDARVKHRVDEWEALS